MTTCILLIFWTGLSMAGISDGFMQDSTENEPVVAGNIGVGNTQISDNFTSTSTVGPQIAAANTLNISPISLVLGSINGNYEHLFAGRHGIFVEGGYGIDNKKGYGGGYRFHYRKETKNNIISSYLGFFIKWQYASTNFEDDDESYDLEFRILTAGFNWGTRYDLWGPLNFAWRIGYGIPFKTEFNWAPQKHDKYKTIEALVKIFTGIDSEVSIGIAF
jgi:hypothetical protein